MNVLRNYRRRSEGTEDGNSVVGDGSNRGGNGAKKLFTIGRHVRDRWNTPSAPLVNKGRWRHMSDSITLHCLETNAVKSYIYLRDPFRYIVSVMEQSSLILAGRRSVLINR